MSDQLQSQADKTKNLMYRDRAEVSETYVDLLRVIFSEGGNIRMEFVVNRLEPPSTPNATITGNSVTACRLVIPIQGALDLKVKLDDLLTKLRAAGIIRTISESPAIIN
jgi:hypothetical protein